MEFLSEEAERGFGYSVSVPFLCRLLSKEILIDSQAAKYSFFKEIPENTIVEHKEFLQTFFRKIKTPLTKRG